MRGRAGIAGVSSLDVFASVVVALSIGLMVGVIADRSFAEDRLAEASRRVTADLERVRRTAIQTGTPMVLRRVSDRGYVAAGATRTLPGDIRFDSESSSRALSFTPLGTLAAREPGRLILTTRSGRRHEISVHPSGELANR